MAWMSIEDIIFEDKDWTAPACRDQEFNVTVFGGGGSGSAGTSIYGDNIGGAGGGSGEMKQGTFILNEGTVIPCMVGAGGKGVKNSTRVCDYTGYSIGKSGGTTCFGTLLSANGGTGGFFNRGGIGGHNGGSTGGNAEGNFYGYGVTDTVNGRTFHSGGGGAGVNAHGIGGQANYCQGDGGPAAGGAGLFIEERDNKIDRRIGSGGRGSIFIRYYMPVGD